MNSYANKKSPFKRALARLVAALIAGLIAGAVLSPDAPREREVASGGPLPLVPQKTEPAAEPVRQGTGAEDAEVTLPSSRLTVSVNGEPHEMELEDYLVGVVAGEMSADSMPEALKAQAVAARTFTALHMAGRAKCKSGCTVCSDPYCCQAYTSADELEKNWGERFPEYYAAIRNAVASTRGLVAVYGGELISALYHASSGGLTESSEAVFAMALPYLVPVDSPEGGGAVSVRELDAGEAAEMLNSAFPEAEIEGPLTANDLAVLELTESGRAGRVKVGRAVETGSAVRMALGLKSTAFSVEFVNDGSPKVRFTCIGCGHGVGMSQLGANDMAAAGFCFRDILAHYYTGTELASLVFEGG